jgi:hypothetical protein
MLGQRIAPLFAGLKVMGVTMCGDGSRAQVPKSEQVASHDAGIRPAAENPRISRNRTVSARAPAATILVFWVCFPHLRQCA